MSQERIPHILFLDDDRSFLEMLENVFTIWSEGRCGIHIAENAGKALGIIQRNEVDLIAVDLVMPILDGVQFLGLLNRKYPKLLKVALSGSNEADKRKACFQAGAELFLEKPSDIESMRSIFSTLEGLALSHMASTLMPIPGNGDDDDDGDGDGDGDGDVGSGSSNGSGFRGMMRVGLSDIVQMECLGRNSSILQVIAHGDKGQVYIEDGEIVHAVTNNQEGVEAFNQIMALKGGEFKLLPFQIPGSKSIEGPWEFLLMEAARLADEQGHEEIQAEENKSARRGYDPDTAVVAPPGTIPPPGRGSSFGGGLPPPGGMEFDFSGVPDMLVGPGMGKVSQPSEADSQEADSSREDLPFLKEEEEPALLSKFESEVGESGSFQQPPADPVSPEPAQEVLDPFWSSGDQMAPTGLDAHDFKSSVSRVQNRNRIRHKTSSTPIPRNAKEILAPEVAEFLIVSDQGVALHEWQTKGVEKRSNFIDLLQSKTSQLAVGLPVGQFERMVVEDVNERFICKIEPEWRIFLRARKQGSKLSGRSWG